MGLHHTQKFLYCKTVNKVKSQLWTGRNISNHRSDKGLIYKIYKELNSKIPDSHILKWAKDLNRYVFQRRHSIDQQVHEKSSALPVIREMQIKTTVKYPLTLVRRTVTTKARDNKCWQGYREKKTLMHCWWECESVQSVWRIVWRSF